MWFFQRSPRDILGAIRFAISKFVQLRPLLRGFLTFWQRVRPNTKVECWSKTLRYTGKLNWRNLMSSLNLTFLPKRIFGLSWALSQYVFYLPFLTVGIEASFWEWIDSRIFYLNRLFLLTASLATYNWICSSWQEPQTTECHAWGCISYLSSWVPPWPRAATSTSLSCATRPTPSSGSWPSGTG